MKNAYLNVVNSFRYTLWIIELSSNHFNQHNVVVSLCTGLFLSAGNSNTAAAKRKKTRSQASSRSITITEQQVAQEIVYCPNRVMAWHSSYVTCKRMHVLHFTYTSFRLNLLFCHMMLCNQHVQDIVRFTFVRCHRFLLHSAPSPMFFLCSPAKIHWCCSKAFENACCTCQLNETLQSNVS